MTIQLKCPNGHNLTAKESNAGKTGKCPICHAAVRIPPKPITESAIMSILSDIDTQQKSRIINAKNRETPSSSVSMPHFKKCPNCEREIDMGYHICPFCHTYITGLNEF